MAERKKEVVRGGFWDMCERTNHRRGLLNGNYPIITRKFKKQNKFSLMSCITSRIRLNIY